MSTQLTFPLISPTLERVQGCAYFGGNNMKRLVLTGALLCGVAAMSVSAQAAVKLELGGFFRGYGVYTDNHEPTGTSVRKFDLRRDSEVHIKGETALENGLIIGFMTEQDLGAATQTDEVYAYASGGWGRVNLGIEDGAAYLLQVSAPSADSNIDGTRVYIQGLNPAVGFGNSDDLATVLGNSAVPGANLDYDHADFRRTDRLTYLTPKFNGMQGGVSYAPKNGNVAGTAAMSSDIDGVGFVDVGGATDSAAEYKNLWEVAARYDATFQSFGLKLGAGYSDSSLEVTPSAATVALLGAGGSQDYYLNDGIRSWNGGANISYGSFNLGGSYKRALTRRIADTNGAGADGAVSGDITIDTWFVGAGYDTGPYHLGASYFHRETDLAAVGPAAAATDIPATARTDTRYTLGGTYTYGAGMTLRGTVSQGKFDASGAAAVDNRYTQVAVGTDVQF